MSTTVSIQKIYYDDLLSTKKSVLLTKYRLKYRSNNAMWLTKEVKIRLI